MTILNIIDLYKNRFDRDGVSGSSWKKADRVGRLVSEYTEAHGHGDMLQLLSPVAVTAMCQWMFDNKAPDATDATVWSYIRTLRRAVRSAMADGIMPPIDVFADVIPALEKRHPLPTADDKPREEFYGKASGDVDKQFLKLLIAVHSSLSEQGKSSKDALLYVFGLFCYGLEIDEMAGLERRQSADGMTKRLYIPKYDMEVPVSGVMRLMLDSYNGPRYSGQHPIKAFDGVDPAERANIANAIKDSIQRFLARNGIELYKGRSIQADWLTVAYGNNASAKDIQIHVTASAVDDDLRAAARRIASRVTDVSGMLDVQWHALCSYDRRMDSDKMEQRLAELGERSSGQIDLKRVSIYNPHETVVKNRGPKTVRKQRAVVSRYLFVKCSNHDCAEIERALVGTSFLRTPDDRRRRATIPDAEMMRLRLFVKDYGRDAELVDIQQYVNDHDLNLAVGIPVAITNGLYEGYEGVIVDVKNDPANPVFTKKFIVKVATIPSLAISLDVTARLSTLDLTPLNCP